MLFSSILVFVILAALIVTCDNMLHSEEEADANKNNYAKALIIAAIVGAVTFIAPKLTGSAAMFSFVLLVVMLGIYAWLALWWHEEGGEIKEMLPFGAIALLLIFPTKSAAASCAEVFDEGIFSSVLGMLATLAFIAFIGYMLVDYFLFLSNVAKKAGKKEQLAKNRKTVAAAIGAITCLALVFALWNGVDWTGATADNGSNAAYAATSDDEVGSQTPDLWAGVHFYNSDVQGGSSRNDFNFGPNPWRGRQSVDYYRSSFAERRGKDPALLSATCVALDGTLGTDYIGEVLYSDYEEKNNMLEAADAATRILAANESTFDKTNNAVTRLLNSAKKVEVKKLHGIKDQLYMHSYTVDGIPSIVSYVSEFNSGWCIIFTFQIKKGSNTTQQVAFHIPCGYQWTNGASKIGVTPGKIPSSPKKVKKPGKKPGKPGRGDNPKKPGKPGTTNKPSYNKDPSKAPSKNTEPNDDKGPGPNTNNPSDPNHSSKDTDDSSSSMTYEQYKDNVNDLNNTNKDQKTNKDPSTPSTKPSPGTNVDNNGDKANTPTPTKPKPKEIDGDGAGGTMSAPK